MPTFNLTRTRLGALALGISALLVFTSLLYIPVDPLVPADLGALWQTGWLFILGMTVFPFGMLALYTSVAQHGGKRLALIALTCQLLAVGPLQVFAGLDTFGLAPLRHSLFQQPNNSESAQVLRVLLAELSQQATPFPLPFPWSLMGLYSLLIIGLLLLDVGMLLLVIVVWRMGTLSRWASLLYAVGHGLFLLAVFAFVGDPLRLVTAIIGGVGGVWLAWSLWRQQPRPIA